jgi:DNA-nicking Smr family endonuclease
LLELKIRKRAPNFAESFIKAKSLRDEKDWLEKQCDRIDALNNHDSMYIDLHDMGFDRALELVKFKIDICREKHPNFRKLNAITGYGKTTGQPSVIRARLIQYLKQRGIE